MGLSGPLIFNIFRYSLMLHGALYAHMNMAMDNPSGDDAPTPRSVAYLFDYL